MLYVSYDLLIPLSQDYKALICFLNPLIEVLSQLLGLKHHIMLDHKDLAFYVLHFFLNGPYLIGLVVEVDFSLILIEDIVIKAMNDVLYSMLQQCISMFPLLIKIIELI
jgi:hypothetical protein